MIRKLNGIFCPAVLVSILFLVLAGCAALRDENKVPELFAQWGEENKKQDLALGEKVYSKNYDQVFTSCITGLASVGLAVKNMERQSGYILAEGPTPIPLTKLKELSEAMVSEINKVSTKRWYSRVGNSTDSATLTLLKMKENQTKVKMRIAVTNIKTQGTAYHSSYPPLLAEKYSEVWRAIEKQMFMDEHLDKTK